MALNISGLTRSGLVFGVALALSACIPIVIPAQPTVRASTTPTAQEALSSEGAAMVRAINAERSARGIAPLVADPALTTAAVRHAQDMQANSYFAHKSPSGSTHVKRIAAAGYSACYAAENIAQGQPSVAAVTASWMASAGHRTNILDPRGQAVGAAKTDGGYWVMVFAAPC
ncbi:Cysteine-rich secretory protein family protein [Aquimixticola soesokkakensis]|uniref:Cysteine-rich secretory protein family protein n=1 Tax=Aquimixticola soesokkakensis TaxID=1519096 RepID=A0A1Y5SVA8_9RHOB|nr:CAP domain-containing protein [Aquimixticola soesokkakensis]SLN49229.1 Cysteine-rich secretory protein family protein [Aquimixticola soesokkakensis]